MTSRSKVRVRILERGKKKKTARKARGRNQRKILFNHGDAENTEKLIIPRVFVAPWLGE
jgi:hypothetical protein